ncbi:MAG: cobalt-precorrin 5A hydrolase [Firmicutes bacterium]|nr:cobalt-precorrin 5A hydrolase [Bacillota bacterium]
MKICVFAITRQGSSLAREVKDRMRAEGRRVELFIWKEHARESEGEHPIGGDLADKVGECFRRFDGMVMIMASGIAVRLIAPHLADKRRDPAVVVMDEKGSFAISLLSGHLGGANRLARELGDLLGAVPVITTSTDVNQTLALDELARERGWRVENPEVLKKVSAALVNGERVLMLADSPRCLEPLPRPDNLDLVELDGADRVPPGNNQGYRAAAVISTRDAVPELPVPTLVIRPAAVVVGIGCRKGASRESIIEAVAGGLKKADRSPGAMRCLATIDLKQDEPGLLAAAESLGLPLLAFERRRIAEIEDRFPSSEWVKSRVGVGAVCEPAAYLAGKNPFRVLGKTRFDGVTVSVYEDTE